jgi:hypothetical protein
MRRLIELSIPLLLLLVPEIWKDTFDWLRRSEYWRWIQFAVVLWIVIVCYGIIPKDWTVKHRVIGTGLFAVIGALVFGGGFFFLSKQKLSPAKGVAEKPLSVRLKYSSRQTIHCKLEDQTQTINLDNVATMTLWSCSRDTVEFLVSKTGPVTIKKTSADQNYKVGGGFVSSFPAAKDPGVSISNVKVVTGSAKKYQFTVDKPVQVIQIGERAFRVSLDQANDDSENGVQKFSYVFAISEE